jgi:alpha-tubulin suppressor-like RCC1 family protein
LLLGGCERLLGLGDIHPNPGPDAPPIPGTWTSVAAGAFHTCGIQADHSLWCFGDNGTGQAGLANVEESPAPMKVGDAMWSAVSSLKNHTCGIQRDGSLWCWGDNGVGELGTVSTVTQAFAPLPVATGTTWRMVSAQVTHTCAIRDDQTLWCWGDNTNGQLATGDTTGATVPTHIANDPGGWIAVAGGDAHTCAVRSDGTLWCWGDNMAGEAGLGAVSGTLVPMQVGTATDWTSVVAGNSHTCGLRGDKAYCWGDNFDGTLGDGSFTRQTTPVPVAASASWTSLIAGLRNTCGLQSDGSLWCWGNSDTGQLAQATAAGVPVQLAGAWTAAAAGTGHTCAIDSVAGLWCVGLNGAGQLGDGTGGSVAAPVLIDATGWTDVELGTQDSCGLQSGALSCWGSNQVGELGDGTGKPKQAPESVAASGVSAVAVNYSHSCRLLGSTLYCVGNNGYGNLGDNSTSDAVVPVRVASPPSTWSSAAVGTSFSCGIDSAANLYCWGRNNLDQVGDGSTTMRTVPVKIGVNYTAVGTGDTYACGITGGKAACWGYGLSGQLGLGMTSSMVDTPTAVVDNHTFTALGVGYYHSCAIDTARALWCWGDDTFGELGDGGNTTIGTPVQAGGSSWTRVASGWFHTCGIQSGGSLWCWGYNSRGQLGDGTRNSHNGPVQIGTGMTWASVSAGQFHTCATTTGGALYCWGTRFIGQLGDGQAWRTTMGRIP